MTYFSLTCDVVRDSLASRPISPQPPSFRQKLGVDQLALVLQQPVDAVVGAAAFFVGGERDDDVAVGLEALRACSG